MRINKFLLLSLVGCSALFSCGPKAIVENQNPDKGNIEYFIHDKKLVMQAHPKDNYLFTGWFKKEKGDDEYRFEAASNPFVFELKNDINFQARFEDYSSQTFCFIINQSGSETYCSLSRYFGEDNNKYDVIIPQTHFGYKVKIIEKETFANYKYLKPITIPDSIEEIKEDAFKNCGISSITITNPNNDVNDDFVGWTSEQTMWISNSCLKIEANESYKTTWNWSLTKHEESEQTYYTSPRFGNNAPHIKVIE